MYVLAVITPNLYAHRASEENLEATVSKITVDFTDDRDASPLRPSLRTNVTGPLIKASNTPSKSTGGLNMLLGSKVGTRLMSFITKKPNMSAVSENVDDNARVSRVTRGKARKLSGEAA